MTRAGKRYRQTRRKRTSAGANTPPGFVRSSTGSIPGTEGPPMGLMTIAQFPVVQFGDPGDHAAVMGSREPTTYDADTEEPRDMGTHIALPKRRRRRTRRLKKYNRQPWSYKKQDKDMLALVAALEKSSLGEKKAINTSDLDADLVKALGALSVGSKAKKGKSKTMKKSRRGSRK